MNFFVDLLSVAVSVVVTYLFLRPVYKSLALWRKSLKMEIEVNQYLLKDHNGVG